MGKIIGISLVVSVCGWVGLEQASLLTRRTQAIRQLRRDLEFLEKEISYGHTPLVEALERTARVSSQPVNLLYWETSRALAKERWLTAREAWERGLKCLEKTGVLSAEELAALKMVGERLGTSDAESQAKMLRLAVAELTLQEEKSRSREEREKKLWSYGGFLTGLMISILLV